MIASVSEASLPPVPLSARRPHTKTEMPVPASSPWVLEAEGGKAELGAPFKAGTQLLPTQTRLDAPSSPWDKEGANVHSTRVTVNAQSKPTSLADHHRIATSSQDIRLGRRPEPPTWQIHILKFCGRDSFVANQSPRGQKQGSQPSQGGVEQSFPPLPVLEDGGKLQGVSSVHTPTEVMPWSPVLSELKATLTSLGCMQTLGGWGGQQCGRQGSQLLPGTLPVPTTRAPRGPGGIGERGWDGDRDTILLGEDRGGGGAAVEGPPSPLQPLPAHSKMPRGRTTLLPGRERWSKEHRNWCRHHPGPTYGLLQGRGESILKGPRQQNAGQLDCPASRNQ